uniref:Uncharacterized protein n=1 Tax=Panagrolaimus sp. PS1159 TaxID=55785 RepID=A0AC35FH16_9BILA
MILSKEFYDKCCLSYQKVIDELEKKIAEIEKCDDATKGLKVISAIYEFSKRHLTPGEYWEHCIHYIEIFRPIYFDTSTYISIKTECEKLRRDIIKRAYYYHLYLNKNWVQIILNWMIFDFYRIVVFSYVMNSPHPETKPPSKDLYKRCEEMISLYPKIRAAIGDIDEWFQLLLKVNNDKYLKDNVECRICHNLHDVKLWKLYISHLKLNGQFKYLLGIYSKYCRFFLDDDEMKKEYEEFMRKYGPVYLPWKNFSKDLIPFDKSICRRFYDTYKVYQEFSLPRPIILYVLKNAGHQVLRKLFASCKWFFTKQQTPICYRLLIGPVEVYEGESLTLKEYSKKKHF